jgi:hypothetical protein
MRSILLAVLCCITCASLPTTTPVGATAACAASTYVYLPTVRYSLPLTIQNVRIGASGLRGGYVALQGEVVNTGAQPLYDIAVELTLYSGFSVEVINVEMLQTNIQPGGAILISILSREVGGTERIDARIIHANHTPATPYVPLTVVSIQKQPDPDQDIFDILLRNDQAVAVSNLRGVIWSFPIERVIPVESLYNVTLQPGETQT